MFRRNLRKEHLPIISWSCHLDIQVHSLQGLEFATPLAPARASRPVSEWKREKSTLMFGIDEATIQTSLCFPTTEDTVLPIPVVPRNLVFQVIKSPSVKFQCSASDTLCPEVGEQRSPHNWARQSRRKSPLLVACVDIYIPLSRLLNRPRSSFEAHTRVLVFRIHADASPQRDLLMMIKVA